MKRIALIATDIALGSEKGLDRMFFLAELLCKNGYEVDIITSRFQHWLKRFRTSQEISGIKSSSNIVCLDEPGYTKNVQVKRIVSRWVLANNVKKHLESTSFDLVYCQIPDNHIASVAAAYAKNRGIPFVADIEDLWPEAMRMVFDVPVLSDVLFSFFAADAKKTYRLSDAVVGSSDTYRDEPLKYGIHIRDSVTVYVGNNMAAFDDGVREFCDKVDKPGSEFWVTYAGTLGTSYDISTMIRAADILHRQGEKDVRIVLLGDGPMRSELEKLSEELDGKVTFAGYLPRGLMAAYLTKSDVVVNSLVSKATQSIVSKIGDYLASGRPMINTGLDPEFCAKVDKDGFGVNVIPEDAQLLAEVIRELKNDPLKCAQMGRTAREIGEQQFDRPRSYMKIVDLVGKLIG